MTSAGYVIGFMNFEGVLSQVNWEVIILLFGMIVLFVLEINTGVPLAFVAPTGGILALLGSRDEPKETFKSVEWPTLVFFIALYGLVGGPYEANLLTDFANILMSISSDVLILAIIMLWVTGLLSLIVDNIPITTVLIPVITILSQTYHSSLLWWALAMGVRMDGNITPIGSSAGVITAPPPKRV